MQEVKSFVYGRKGTDVINEFRPIEQQINEFLKENPNHIAKSITIVNSTYYQEAFVIFDIRNEEKTNYKKTTKLNGGNNNG